MRARYPDLPFPEITKRLGAEWTRLAPNDKQVTFCVLTYLLMLSNSVPIHSNAKIAIAYGTAVINHCVDNCVLFSKIFNTKNYHVRLKT